MLRIVHVAILVFVLIWIKNDFTLSICNLHITKKSIVNLHKQNHVLHDNLYSTDLTITYIIPKYASHEP